MDVCFVKQALVSIKGDHSATDLNILTSKSLDFCGKDFFQALHGFNNVRLLGHFLAFDCIIRVLGATSSVIQIFPPMVAPSPIITRPRMVALE